MLFERSIKYGEMLKAKAEKNKARHDEHERIMNGIILLSASGKTNAEMAKALGVGVPNISYWKRYMDKVELAYTKTPAGRPKAPTICPHCNKQI
jgi:hypothetical protein